MTCHETPSSPRQNRLIVRTERRQRPIRAGGVLVILGGTGLVIYGFRGRAVTTREPG
jgi:hypothetical protein